MKERTRPLIKEWIRNIIKILIISLLLFLLLAGYTAFAMEFRYWPEFSIFLVLVIIALQNKAVIEQDKEEQEDE